MLIHFAKFEMGLQNLFPMNNSRICHTRGEISKDYYTPLYKRLYNVHHDILFDRFEFFKIFDTISIEI